MRSKVISPVYSYIFFKLQNISMDLFAVANKQNKTTAQQQQQQKDKKLYIYHNSLYQIFW